VSIPNPTTSRQIFSFSPSTQTPTPKSDDELFHSFVGGEPTVQGTPFKHYDWTSSLLWRTNPKTEPEQRSETASDPEIEQTPE
jgi:hypothetical protein